MISRKVIAHSVYGTSFLTIFLSFLIVAFAQPDWSQLLSLMAALGGYALFWKGIENFSLRNKFFTSWIWMGFIQWIQLHWLSSDHYLGPMIHIVLFLFCLWIGFQFALLSLVVRKSALSAAALWTLFEWSRLYFLSGYTLNPVGLILSGSQYSLQLASFVGVFGLSFFVMLSNLLLYHHKKMALLTYLFPFILGAVLVHSYEKKMEGAPSLHALLVQHATLPEKMNGDVWQKICALVAPYADQKFDLILLSEAALPYSATKPIFSLAWVDALFSHFFDGRKSGLVDSYVSNMQIARALATLLDTTIVMGVEDSQHNAAFALSQDKSSSYYKQVLLPFGEYLPLGFGWCASMIPGFTSFIPGKKTTLLQDTYGVSICYEETVSHLMRKSKLLGAKCLLNLSNDVWYPGSRLCMVHYLHGRIRAVELGLPLLRACNTGLTCGVTSTGKLVNFLPSESSKEVAKPAALALRIPLYQFPTLYTYVGNYLMVSLSLLLIIVFPPSFLLPKKG